MAEKAAGTAPFGDGFAVFADSAAGDGSVGGKVDVLACEGAGIESGVGAAGEKGGNDDGDDASRFVQGFFTLEHDVAEAVFSFLEEAFRGVEAAVAFARADAFDVEDFFGISTTGGEELAEVGVGIVANGEDFDPFGLKLLEGVLRGVAFVLLREIYQGGADFFGVGGGLGFG